MRTTAPDRIAGLPAENGLDGLASAVTALLDGVMEIERARAPAAAPHQRPEQRTGRADGPKPRTTRARIGPPTLDVPQARGVGFRPSAPEGGARSGRALKPAVAEMDARGVSTREVAAVAEALCGSEVTGSRVDRAAGASDAEPEKWPDRPPGATPYPILSPIPATSASGTAARSAPARPRRPSASTPGPARTLSKVGKL